MKESGFEKSNPISFDQYAEDYDAALEQGISVSGEDKEFFANARVQYLAKSLKKYGIVPSKILDFGCGTGSAIPHFLKTFPHASIVGVDVSSKSIETAKHLHKSDRVHFAISEESWSDSSFDLVFCNGVFHHIRPEFRIEALASISRALKPSGLFCFWENNPWNPGTRIVMSRIPFDRDAQTISPVSARRLLVKAGFSILESTSTFYFPRMLSLLRPLEGILGKLPLGAQYQVLANKMAFVSGPLV
jgi:SAM-dependent methyltransferase